MRRLAAVLLALCVAAAAVWLGLRAVPAASGQPAQPTSPLAAPVLTARRVPVLLATPVGERRLVAGLDGFAAGLPTPSCVVVGEGERTLYEAGPGAPVIPASTLKLVTAATVLAHVDAAERLETSVRVAEPAVDGVVAGDLWLVGGGDPVLGTEAWGSTFERQPALRTPLEALADRVVAAGIRTVQGRVLGDESRYDTLRVVPTWPDRYRQQHQIGPLSALTVNDGFARFDGAREAFAEPAVGAAAVFTDLLRGRGVAVVGEPSAAPSPEGATAVASIDSPPVLQLVGEMLRESDNGTAELLLKEVGRRVAGTGTTAAGAEVVEATLADLGLPLQNVDVVDGSGLDRGNQLTCALLHELLVVVDAGGDVEGGLAVAGVTGTLAERFLETPVNGRLRAKTGSLNGVAALAGYADTRNEGELTFAFVMNGLPVGADPTSQLGALAELLVSYPDLPAVAELGPGAWPGVAPPG